MNQTVTPYNDSQRSKKEQVEEMFDNIAYRYDFLNHLLSLGIDITWRKKAIKSLQSIQPKRILDVASGTGDFAMEALSLKPETIVGFDLSEGMMQYGRAKATKMGVSNIVEFVKGDSEQMPFADNSFDAITVGFGVRNFENLEAGLREMHRVLRHGGKVAILEASMPRNTIIRALYSLYFGKIVPLIGKMFSKDARAYSYLPESVKAFPEGLEFVRILENIGFRNVEYAPLTFGACAFYRMEK
ncbi:MAG: bifunctional demethylmenaquinone methyltransferase/2-methoxy-6-polyprenyl-1,4-benzoquinol methylase UbiE [Chitinophagales bacterium]|nr:bifunctional demethylmenaquinone methyltransferase/2-methoxy-6-polyprenyl-1,4-benzoquinol methylase UbiE [Chitinophagales bacterium]